MKRLLQGIALILNAALNISAGWTFIGLAFGAVGTLLVFCPERKV